MTFIIATLAAGLLGALMWRMRGGFLMPSTQVGRIFAVLPLVAIGYALAGWPAALAAALLFPTTLLPWGKWMDMGTMGDDDDLVGMTGRGFVQTSLAAAGLAVAASPLAGLIYLFAGALMGPIYWGAWKAFPRVKPEGRLGSNVFIDGPTSIAELAVGFVLYAAFVLVVA